MLYPGFRFLVFAGFAVFACRIEADPITFASSNLTAAVNYGASYNAIYVYPPQITGTTTDADGNATSTTVGNFLSTGLSFSFTQTITTSPDYTSGGGYDYFDLGSDVTYTITDPSPVVVGASDVEAFADLYDVTTNILIYDTITDPSGEQSGQLTAGDEYEFSGGLTSIASPALLMYDPSIAFSLVTTVPEPQDLVFVISVVLGGLALRRRLA